MVISYTLEKAEFSKWEAAFQTMGCEVRHQGDGKDKIPQRARSGSLSRIMSISRSGGGGGGLAVPDPAGGLSGKLSKSSNDLSGADSDASKTRA